MSEAIFTFPVEGIHCSGCANLVRSILEEDVEGVTRADVKMDPHEVAIHCDDAMFNKHNAADIMHKNGYTLVI